MSCFVEGRGGVERVGGEVGCGCGFVRGVVFV